MVMWYNSRLGWSTGRTGWGHDEQSEGSLCSQFNTRHKWRETEGNF